MERAELSAKARLQEKFKGDVQHTDVITHGEKAFRREMKNWKFNPKNPASPLLTTPAKDLIIEGYFRIIEGFDYAESDTTQNRIMKHTHQSILERRTHPANLSALARESAALWLEQQLHKLPEIASQPDADKAVEILLGSAIKRAIRTAHELDIPITHSIVRRELFGDYLPGHLDQVGILSERVRAEKSDNGVKSR
ncbi:MAG: hypothetical protein ACN2B6_09865 [Rickettsiales bacterium]